MVRIGGSRGHSQCVPPPPLTGSHFFRLSKILLDVAALGVGVPLREILDRNVECIIFLPIKRSNSMVAFSRRGLTSSKSIVANVMTCSLVKPMVCISEPNCFDEMAVAKMSFKVPSSTSFFTYFIESSRPPKGTKKTTHLQRKKEVYQTIPSAKRMPGYGLMYEFGKLNHTLCIVWLRSQIIPWYSLATISQPRLWCNRPEVLPLKK